LEEVGVTRQFEGDSGGRSIASNDGNIVHEPIARDGRIHVILHIDPLRYAGMGNKGVAYIVIEGSSTELKSSASLRGNVCESGFLTEVPVHFRDSGIAAVSYDF
jgi:hypothetical protein